MSDLTAKTFLIDPSLTALAVTVGQTVSARQLLAEFSRAGEVGQEAATVGSKVAVMGSVEEVVPGRDFGFFSAVLEAYNKHWVLDTCPEDWLYTVVQTIARSKKHHR